MFRLCIWQKRPISMGPLSPLVTPSRWLRQSIVLTQPGVLTCTRRNWIHPQLLRLLVNAGGVLLQSFFVAYQRESARSRSDEQEPKGSSSSTAASSVMSAAEAIEILGVEQVNSQLLEDAKKSKNVLPLRNAKEIETAKTNFELMRAVATKQNNLYLMGKLSAAYRLCVDPNWDASTESPK